MNCRRVAVWACAVFLVTPAFAGRLTERIAASCPVKGTDRFYGFERTTFDFQGHEAWVVEPSVEPAEGCPWTWTMQWATAFVDRTPALHLLKEGWHHVTIDTFRHRMDEEGIAVSAAFQKFLVEKLGFAPKACLIGMSWGGFFSTRYTAAHPENVRAIYYDCPLLNFDKFRDFPPEKVRGEIGVWGESVPAGGWSDDPRMPVNMAATIAAAKIPVYLVYGGADRVVPPETNCEVFLPRFKAAGGQATVDRRGAYGHHPHGVETGDTRLAAFFYEATYGKKPVFGRKIARPRPSVALRERLRSDVDVIGIVHWGLNTYTDREWGFGDEDPAKLDPKAFDADQIVGACAAGGLKGLVIVAKHHDGFCLWPTKTTEHNITKSPFRGGRGDYVREMERACRKHGLKFGVYVSPWDRNNAHYGTEKYVSLYHEQIKELLSGDYGEVFEMWFDGANGGDGWYGGANEKRIIPNGYYRFDELFAFVRKLQPKVCIFAGENDASDFRWPGNEQGRLDPNSRATICSVGGFADGEYGNPDYAYQINTGSPSGRFFRACEADFPLRKGWFYHAKDDGRSKHAAYLLQRYLDTVGNGGTMNLGVSPTRDGVLPSEDVKALAGFKTLKDAFFAHEVTADGQPFNVVVLSEDISAGEQVDHWTLFGDKRPDGLRDWIAGGRAIGRRRIRILDKTYAPKKAELCVAKTGPNPGKVTFRRYLVDEELLNLVRTATTDSGETDTAKWMTGAR